MVELKEPTSNNQSFFNKVFNYKNFDSKDYLLGLTLLTYISGFLITNFFLGSLGVVHFDLLRVKYIISGILYLFFLASILFPTFGLRYVLRENSDRSWMYLIFRACIYTLTVLS